MKTKKSIDLSPLAIDTATLRAKACGGFGPAVDTILTHYGELMLSLVGSIDPKLVALLVPELRAAGPTRMIRPDVLELTKGLSYPQMLALLDLAEQEVEVEG